MSKSLPKTTQRSSVASTHQTCILRICWWHNRKILQSHRCQRRKYPWWCVYWKRWLIYPAQVPRVLGIKPWDKFNLHLISCGYLTLEPQGFGHIPKNIFEKKWARHNHTHKHTLTHHIVPNVIKDFESSRVRRYRQQSLSVPVQRI